MSAGHDHREPLDADERDLAARLARIGPLDGPSPSLDAKILAAAHAAAATRRPGRSRWLAWVGVPPALVTGVGVAAAAVLVLGLVWQLRPQVGVLPAQDEAAGADEEVFIIAEPSTRARAPIVNPPPFPAEPQMPAQPARAAGEVESKTADAAASVANAPSASADNANQAASAAAPAPSVAAEMSAAAATAATGDAKEEAGFVATPPGAPAAQARKQAHATYTTAARATAERRERAAGLVAPAPQASAAAPAEAESDRSAPDRAALDRVEVTGSRVKRSDADAYEPLAKVSVSEDKVLPAGEWLERIRARRDEGDMDGARASLRLFRREHPRVRVPDDLRALLASDAKQ